MPHVARYVKSERLIVECIQPVVFAGNYQNPGVYQALHGEGEHHGPPRVVVSAVAVGVVVVRHAKMSAEPIVGFLSGAGWHGPKLVR